MLPLFFSSGRASSSPILDLFITFLSIGSRKYVDLVKKRKALFQTLKDGLSAVATKHGLRVLHTPGNSISIGTISHCYTI